jgi:hypothetical protein
MALTNLQALGVVLACVKAVGGRNVGPTDALADGGVVDDPRLNALRSTIVTDPGIGVRQCGHRIAASALDGLGTNDSAQDAADVVRDNAVPLV